MTQEEDGMLTSILTLSFGTKSTTKLSVIPPAALYAKEVPLVLIAVGGSVGRMPTECGLKEWINLPGIESGA